MRMDEVRRGQKVRIVSITNQMAKVQAIRFGIGEGTVLSCEEIIPSGPVVIRSNRQEIAIGRRLAREIAVEPVA
ncbi:MAG: FeoA family protein [Bacillota bacterium]